MKTPDQSAIKNHLYFGDCLDVMRKRMQPKSVDLIYLDPPFNSNRTYNTIYLDKKGRTLPEQVEAFDDVWRWDAEREDMVIQSLMGEADGVIADMLKLWKGVLRKSNSSLLAYLFYMTERLVAMKRVLKDTGSIYLHCDDNADAYLKVIMDAIFGIKYHKNRVIWKRTSAHNDSNSYGRVSDTILVYSRVKKMPNIDNVLVPLDEEYVKNHYRHEDTKAREAKYPLKIFKNSSKSGDSWNKYQEGDLTGAGTSKGESGKAWRGYDPTKIGRHWAVPKTGDYAEWLNEQFQGYTDIEGIHDRLEFLYERDIIFFSSNGVPRLKRYYAGNKGQKLGDIWSDIYPVSSRSKERTRFPTQKPLKLLERIIEVSSNEGDVVFDPFCGCATTIVAAQKLKRRWVGIDIALHAIKLFSEMRLQRDYGLVEGLDYDIDGIPLTLEGAIALHKRDPHLFQEWAIKEVGGTPSDKKTRDGGIDGNIGFWSNDRPKKKLRMAIQVKGGGKVKPDDARALTNALRRERGDVEMVGLITRNDLGREQKSNFIDELGDDKTFTQGKHRYPRFQILSVNDILNGEIFEVPQLAERMAEQQHIWGKMVGVS